MGLVIRSMKLSDLDAICILEQKCFKTPWDRSSFEKELTENRLAHYLVVELDGSVVGYGGMWFILDEAHITNIAIDPECRNRGLGQVLIENMIKLGSANGIQYYTLEVRTSNIKAINLYKKMGFVDKGIRPKYYTDTGEDAMIMWKTVGEVTDEISKMDQILNKA